MKSVQKALPAFTIIELMLVVSITLILCSIGVPYFFKNSEQEIIQELEKLEVTLLYLQQKAIASGQSQELIFDPAHNKYWYTNHQKQVTYSFSPETRLGSIPGVLGPPAQPVAPITSPLTFVNQKTGLSVVKLFQTGKISPGSVYITDKYKKAMGALTCGVSQVSYIRRYLYKNNQWKLV